MWSLSSHLMVLCDRPLFSARGVGLSAEAACSTLRTSEDHLIFPHTSRSFQHPCFHSYLSRWTGVTVTWPVTPYHHPPPPKSSIFTFFSLWYLRLYFSPAPCHPFWGPFTHHYPPKKDAPVAPHLHFGAPLSTITPLTWCSVAPPPHFGAPSHTHDMPVLVPLNQAALNCLLIKNS